jgi:hypothetical protein
VRRNELDDWRPAIGDITVTAVVSHGIRLQIGPWQDLVRDGDIAWPLFGHARAPLCVYVRNDGRELIELRAVVVLNGDGDRARPTRLRLRR